MIPEQLRKPEFRFNKVGDNKIPIENEWQSKNNYTFEEATDFLRYGVVCGYGNLIVIDFDKKEIQERFFDKFPETFTVKTAGKGLYHLYFLTEEDPETKRLNDKDGKRIADIQGKGTFVVGPNVVLENGRKYQVVKDLPITYIPYVQIKEVFMEFWDNKNKQDKINLKSMNGVKEGERNDICFKKACSLFSRGFNKTDVYDILQTWNSRNEPPLLKNQVLRCIESATKYEYKAKPIPTTVFPLDNYLANAKEYHKIQPFFYDRNKIFWKWNLDQGRYDIIDEVDIMLDLDKVLGFSGQTIANRDKTNYLEALRWVGRENIPKEAPKKWIQFKDKAYSIESGHIYDVEPNYFFTNPIPWEIGGSAKTPVLDKLFEEWVGEEYVNTLYEIIVYCTYRGYPLQTLFCLYGSGRNGKSCFQRVLKKFLGSLNISSTELDLLVDGRFESFKLFKKLGCFMGETDMGTMTKSSLLKKLVGGDLIGFEKKGKDPFDAENYAKIIIASNSLPSSDDTSEGFYRRWLIIDFPNRFPEGKDILDSIPDEEYNNLARKTIELLPKLLKKASFSGQGTVKEREDKYIMASNPLPLFIKQCCIVDDDSCNYVSYNELYNAYCMFLKINKRRRVKQKEFKTALSEEGFFPEKTSKKTDDLNDSYKIIYWIDGISLKANWKDFAQNSYFAHVSTSFPYIEKLIVNSCKNGKKSKKTGVPSEIEVEEIEE